MRKAVQFLLFVVIGISIIYLLAVAKPASAATGINPTINFQSKVVNSDGTNVSDGTYDFVFKVYDGANSTSNTLFTESWISSALWSSTMTSAPSSGGESLTYSSDTNESSLKVGQILTNITKGEQVVITSVDTSGNVLGISPTAQAWANSDTVTNKIWVKNGIFRVAINSLNQNWGTVDFNTNSLFLGINFNSDGEAKPRIQMAAAPYAMNSNEVNGISFSGTSGNTYTLPSTNNGTIITSNAPSQSVTTTQTSGTALTLSDSTAITGSVTGLSITLSGSGSFDQTGLQFNLSNATGTNLNDIMGTGGSWKVSKNGVLTVASCIGCDSATNLFNSGSGAIFEKNTTLDFLIGGQASNSAKFAILNMSGSGTPTASVSGGLNGNAAYLTANGVLATQNKQTLQIGDSNTGNILLNTNVLGFTLVGNITGSGSPNVTGIGTLTGTTLQAGTFQGNSASVTFGNGGFQTSLAGTNIGTGFVKSASGVLSTSSTVNLATEVSGFLGFANGGSPFTQTGGAIYPLNSTVDLLFGGQGTTSAKFAILNMSGNGTPTASVSSGLNGMGSYLTADGTLATTRRQSLILGNSSTYNTTGNVLINPNGQGNVGIGTSTPTTALQIVGSSATEFVAESLVNTAASANELTTLDFLQASGGTITPVAAIKSKLYAGGNDGELQFWTDGGGTSAEEMVITNIGNLGIGTASPIGVLEVYGGNTGGNAAGIFDQRGASQNDILTASSSGTTKFVITNGGNLVFAGGSSHLITLTGTGISANTTISIPSGVGASDTFCLHDLANCASGVGTNYWQLNSGVLSPFSSTLDLTIGGSTTGSAKFAFLNVNSGNPTFEVFNSAMTKSISIYHDGTNGNISVSNGTLNISGSSGDITLDAGSSNTVVNLSSTGDFLIKRAGTIFGTFSHAAGNADLILDNATPGDLFTASSGGTTKFTVANNGDLTLTGAIKIGGSTGTGLCLTGGSTVSWGVCGGGSNYWQVNSGALSPFSETLDFLLGSTSSSSARFGVLNVLTGNPTIQLAYDSTHYMTSAIGSGGSVTWNLSASAAIYTYTNALTITPYSGSGGGILTFLSSGGSNPSISTDSTGDLNFSAPGGLITLGSGTGDITFQPGGPYNVVANLNAANASGDFLIQQNGTTFATFGHDQLITFTSTASATTAFTLNAASLTTGTGFAINGTSGGTGNGITGSLLSLASNLGNTTNTDGLLKSIAKINTGASSANAINLYLLTQNANTTNADKAYGIYNAVNDETTSLSNSLYGLYSTINASGSATSGTRNVYGVYTSVGGISGSGGTLNAYGVYIANPTGANAMTTTGTTTNTGLYVEAPTGADNNYAAIFAGGNVGVGTANPGALLAISGASLTSGTALQLTGPTGGSAGITGNFSSITSNLGASGSLLYLTGTDNDTTGANAQGINISLTNTPTSSANSLYGLDSQVTDTTALGDSFYGIGGNATFNGSGTPTNLAVGVSASTISHAGTLAKAEAGYFVNISTGGNITNSYGVYIDTPVNGGGTITTNYGLYLANQTGATTNYSIYSAGGTSYFTGNVGIGTNATTPTGILYVSGTTTGNAAAIIDQRTATGDIFTASASGTTKFVIDKNGNVGIGTANPQAILDVAGGNVQIEAQTNSTTALSSVSTGPGQFSAQALIASASAMAVYNGSLYVGTGKGSANHAGTAPAAGAAGGAEVYQYNGSKGAWTVENSSPGTFNTTTTIASVSAMTVFNGNLYIGTSKAQNAEVYRYGGGTTWTSVTPASGKFNTTTSIDSVQSMVVCGGKMFIGTKESAKAEVYRYDGNFTWTALNTTAGTFITGTTTSIDGVPSMACYNNTLYIGTKKGLAAEVYRYDGGTGITSGTNWTKVSNGTGTIGSGGATNASEVSAMVVYNGKLYAATETGVNGTPGGNSAEVWRYDDNTVGTNGGFSWTRITNAAGTVRNGGTTNIDGIKSMTVYNGRLYVGTDEPSKAELYQYIDGTDWILVSTTTAGQLAIGGTSSIDRISSMVQYNSVLFAGTSKDAVTNVAGAEVYTYTDISDESYALKFSAASQTVSPQSGFPNTASIWYEASPSGQVNGGSGQGSFMFSSGIVTNAGAYDVAEDYPTRDTSLQPGDVISIQTGEAGMVEKSQDSYDTHILGVYSANPALHLSQMDQSIDGAQAVAVALVGRVPVTVDTENGPIQNGDFLTSSSTPGVAMKATKAGFVVGQALGDFSCPDNTTSVCTGSVTMFVRTGYMNGEQFTDNQKDATEVLADVMGASTASSDANSQISTDRVVAGLDVITPHVTADTVTARLLTGVQGLTFSNQQSSLSADLNDIVGSGNNWKISQTGAISASSQTINSGGVTVNGGGVSINSGDLSINSGTIRSSGTIKLIAGGLDMTGNVQIGTGDGSSSPNLLVLDKKTTAGDPVGTNGAMYYNNETNTFRCFEDGAWRNCNVGNVLQAASDVSTLSTTGSDVTGLMWPAAANTTYSFECTLITSTADTATGIQVGMNGPANPASVIASINVPTDTDSVGNPITATNYETYQPNTVSAGESKIIGEINGIVQNGDTAGILAIRLRSSSGRTVTIGKGSTCTWH